MNRVANIFILRIQNIRFSVQTKGEDESLEIHNRIPILISWMKHPTEEAEFTDADLLKIWSP
jgi:hypothetical protein